MMSDMSSGQTNSVGVYVEWVVGAEWVWGYVLRVGLRLWAQSEREKWCVCVGVGVGVGVCVCVRACVRACVRE